MFQVLFGLLNLGSPNKSLLKEESKQPLPQKQLLPFRPARYRSIDSLIRASKIWNYLVMSLPADLLILLILDKYNLTNRLTFATDTILLAVISISLFFLAIYSPSTIFLKLKNFQNKFSTLQNTKIYWIIAILLAIGPIFDLFIHISRIGNSVNWIVVAAISCIGIFKIIKETKVGRIETEALAKDQMLWVEQANRDLYSFSLIPLILARSLSFIALLHFTSEINGLNQTYYNFLPFFLGSFIILNYFKPNQSVFMANCPQCKILTSIVVKQLNCCPVCDPKYFQVEIEDYLLVIQEKKTEQESLVENQGIKPSEKPSNSSSWSRYSETTLSLIEFFTKRIKKNSI